MFITEYLKNPRNIGAVAPSSRHLAEKMIERIDFAKAGCIVEYGPGTGVFTEKILAKAKEDTIIILIETDEKFYKMLKKTYGYKNNVVILNRSAEDIDNILKANGVKKVDYIVSGLPFASLPQNMSDNILYKTAEVLSVRGEFITFQYTLLKKKLFKKYFSDINIDRAMINFPPAYVLNCRR